MRVLFLTHRVPYAPNRGDRIRAFHAMRYLALRCKLHVVALAHDAREAARALPPDIDARLTILRVPQFRNRLRAAFALAGQTPLTHVLLDSPALRPVMREICERERPDVVLAYGSGMARLVMEPPLSGIPFVLDLVDVDSLKWRELAAKSSWPLRMVYAREAGVLARFEAKAARAGRGTLVINDREREALRNVAPDVEATVVGNGIDVEYFHRGDTWCPQPTVVFSGVFNYSPNESGACWLMQNVWPAVVRDVPAARLILVGASPTRRVRRLAERARSVEVTGGVRDVRPYLWRGWVGAAPLHVARGFQNKVMEGVAAGLPFVVTPAVAEGLPAAIRPAVRIADDPGGFASHLVDLLRRPDERAAMLHGVSLQDFTWPRVLEPLAHMLRAAAAS
jgi:sugar transferase (PEP-CTERM/EpsH1 system associated)